jgi:hypothetical protein
LFEVLVVALELFVAVGSEVVLEAGTGAVVVCSGSIKVVVVWPA